MDNINSAGSSENCEIYMPKQTKVYKPVGYIRKRPSKHPAKGGGETVHLLHLFKSSDVVNTRRIPNLPAKTSKATASLCDLCYETSYYTFLVNRALLEKIAQHLPLEVSRSREQLTACSSCSQIIDKFHNLYQRCSITHQPDQNKNSQAASKSVFEMVSEAGAALQPCSGTFTVSINMQKEMQERKRLETTKAAVPTKTSVPNILHRAAIPVSNCVPVKKPNNTVTSGSYHPVVINARPSVIKYTANPIVDIPSELVTCDNSTVSNSHPVITISCPSINEPASSLDIRRDSVHIEKCSNTVSSINPTEYHIKLPNSYTNKRPWKPAEVQKMVLYPCAMCQGNFDTFALLQGHCSRKHGKYLCSLCGDGKYFSSSLAMRKHLKFEHTTQFRCPICFASFLSKGRLVTHIGSMHNDG